MKRRTQAFIVIVSVLLTTGIGSMAIGASLPRQINIEITSEEFAKQGDISKSIAVPAGGILNLTLASNPSTGFSWNNVAQIGDRTVLQQTANKYSDQETGGVMGAGGKETWTFKALQPGTTTVRMEYAQPWADSENGARTLQLTVTVS